MNDFKYVSEQYDLNKTIAYRLSIQLNPDGFSVLIADIHKNIMFLLHRQSETNAESITELKENTDLFPITKLRFNKAVILINTPEFTLVPQELYTEDLKELYFKYNHPLKDYETVLDCQLEIHKAVLLFKLDEKFISLIKSFHNSPAVVHSSVPYLEYIHSSPSEGDILYIHQTGPLLSLSALRNNRLLLHNLIDVGEDNDVIYFTVNTLKQLEMSREKTEIIYSGTLNRNSKAIEVLSRYVDGIRPLKNEFPFELAGNLNENYFINLLKSTGCV